MDHPQTICSIVKTLYPSYLEHLTNPSTEALIQEHLKDCSACRDFIRINGYPACHGEPLGYTEGFPPIDAGHMEAIPPTHAKGISPIGDKHIEEISYLKRYRTMFFAVLGGVALGVLLFALLLFGLFSGINKFMDRFLKQSTIHSESVSDYREWDNYQGISEFSIFPKDLFRCQSVNDYYYDCDSSIASTCLQLYLDCSYTPSEYEAEKERLLQTAHADTDHRFFAYPACYTMLFYDTACEYALFLEEEHRIIYISLQYTALNELVFEERYLPLDYGTYGAPPENQAKPYCIYAPAAKETHDYEK